MRKIIQAAFVTLAIGIITAAILKILYFILFKL